MRSDERRLKLSCCIVRSLINATIQGFHRDEELMLKARRLFANHSHRVNHLRQHGIIKILIFSSFIEINQINVIFFAIIITSG